ncbi:MAG TPA: copper-binding protein [Azospirillum sp.]
MRRNVAAAALALLMTVPAAAWAQAGHDHHGTSADQTAGTTGKVNAVDAAKRTVNLSHGPIPALGWAAMTMEFGVAPAVNLGSLKPGDTVRFTVVKDAKGVYQIGSLTASN